MMGAGIFINVVELTKRAGFLSCLAYALVGVLMLPLVVSIASMIRLHPSGGFYAFAAEEINPFAGFLSAWSYFIGKLGSAMLLIHTAMSLCKQIIPALVAINIFCLDIFFLSFFMLLNMFNMRTGRTIQGWLTIIKIVPMFFVIFVSLYCMNPANLIIPAAAYTGLFSAIPLVIYAFLGFEATVSLSSKIENAQRNGPLAIFISYACVVGLYVVYQFLFCAAAGQSLIMQQNYLGAFPSLLTALFGPHVASFAFVHVLLNLAIAASALGGSYGILYSNSWNLFFTRMNAQSIPFACILTEGIIACFYLYMSAGQQLPLQLTSVLGSIIAYTLSVTALFCAWHYKRSVKNPWIIILALINCGVLLFACVRSLSSATLNPLMGFLALLIAGILMYRFTNKR